MEHKPPSSVTSGGDTKAGERDGGTGVPGTTWGAGRYRWLRWGVGGRPDKDAAS